MWATRLSYERPAIKSALGAELGPRRWSRPGSATPSRASHRHRRRASSAPRPSERVAVVGSAEEGSQVRSELSVAGHRDMAAVADEMQAAAGDELGGLLEQGRAVEPVALPAMMSVGAVIGVVQAARSKPSSASIVLAMSAQSPGLRTSRRRAASRRQQLRSCPAGAAPVRPQRSPQRAGTCHSG
jgi:hypothetical protein